MCESRCKEARRRHLGDCVKIAQKLPHRKWSDKLFMVAFIPSDMIYAFAIDKLNKLLRRNNIRRVIQILQLPLF